MADNYRKCDLCGVFFPVSGSYRRIELPNTSLYSRKNGITNHNIKPFNVPIRCATAAMFIDVCGGCLEEIINTLRRLSKNGN